MLKTSKKLIEYPMEAQFWLFGVGYIKDLPWDLEEWHWRHIPLLGDAPFFRYISKRGYKTHSKWVLPTSMGLNFIQMLNLNMIVD
jgi:hypothetical protein